MRSRKVISDANLSPRLPIWQTVTCALALDYWNAPLWLSIAFGVYFLAGWVLAIDKIINQDPIDVFNKKQELRGIGH